MTYFQKFPHIVYEFNNTHTVVKDIFVRSAFISEYKPLTDLYSSYIIQDGETPQTIAAAMYGSAFYHWVVLMFNEIHNPYLDWPLTTQTLEKYCTDKYGAAMYMIKHYVSSDGNVVGEVKVFSSPGTWIPPTDLGNNIGISFYDYESQLNEEKRHITLLRPELLGEFVKQFGDSVQ